VYEKAYVSVVLGSYNRRAFFDDNDSIRHDLVSTDHEIIVVTEF
jgi:hypothetical protein